MIRRALESALARVAGRRHGSESTLIVPVPAAEPALIAALGRSPAADDGELPAHVTVLYPFLLPGAIDADAERAIADVLRRFDCFGFRLARVARFPGVLYLKPEPIEPFRALTQAFCARWPQHQPYEGVFDEVVPHLTVTTEREPPGAAATLERLLPIETRASDVWLLTRSREGGWSVCNRFPLQRER